MSNLLRLRSARDLRLQIRWRYGFVGYNQKVSSTPGVVYIDVGSSTPAPGIIDHHHVGAGFSCSADVVAQRPDFVYGHLLGPWIERADDGRLQPDAPWEPLLVTHAFPDWDSAATAVLIEHLIEFGRLPDRAEELAQYTASIDQGRWRLEGEPTAPHLAMLMAAHRDGRDYARTLATGMALVRVWLDDPEPDAWMRHPAFGDLAAALARESDAYQADKAAAERIDAFPVAAADHGEHLRIPAMLLDRPPACNLNKYFVRGEGYPLFLCPYHDGRHVIVSLDPSYAKDGRRPTLEGLGALLEREEIAARAAANQGADDRPGPPRWPDGVCTNSDPWYDGRDKDYTLVQSPARGTVLPLTRIRSLLDGAAYAETPLNGAEVALLWCEEAGSVKRSEVTGQFRAGPVLLNSTPLQLDGFAGTAVRLTLDEPGLPAPDIRLLRISAKADESLESLLSSVRQLSRTFGARPRYVLACVSVRPWANHERALEVLRRMGDGELQQRDTPRPYLHNARHLLRLVAQDDHSCEKELPAVVFAALLSETLTGVSNDIAAKGVDVAESVREAFIRFEARYYRRDISGHAAAQDAFNMLAGEMHLAARLEEIHAELARLAELQSETGRKHLELLGLLIGVAGVLQTVATYFSLSSSPNVANVLASFALTVLVIMLLFGWRVRRRLSDAAFWLLLVLGCLIIGAIWYGARF